MYVPDILNWIILSKNEKDQWEPTKNHRKLPRNLWICPIIIGMKELS